MRNAIMHASHIILFDHEGLRELVVNDKIIMLSVPVKFWIWIRAIRRGIEPINV